MTYLLRSGLLPYPNITYLLRSDLLQSSTMTYLLRSGLLLQTEPAGEWWVRRGVLV